MIITRTHPRFPEFVQRLEKQLDGPEGCRHDHAATFEVLNAMGAEIAGTLGYLREHGGHCDCEVIFNVVLGEWKD